MDKITEQIIKVNLENQIKHNKSLLPINLAGAPGIGKTTTIENITESIGAGFINLSVPNVRLEQLSGIPQFKSLDSFNKYSVTGVSHSEGTTWTVPEIIVLANTLAEKKGSCVILLDDFHAVSSNKSVQDIMYEFLLERKLGDYRLHENVALICAMNDSAEAGFSGLSSAINSRLATIKINYNHEEWMHNFGNRLHYLVASFLKANPQFAIEPESTSTESSASPRSWTYFSNNLELFDRDFITQNVLTLAKQFISNEAAEAFQKHTIYFNSMDFTDIVKSKKIQVVADLPFGDQLFWPYIVNFLETPEDTVYAIDLMNANKSDSQFIGLIAADMFIKYLAIQANKEVSVGIRILIDKFIGAYSESTYSLTTKQKELLTNANLANQSDLLAYANSYIRTSDKS